MGMCSHKKRSSSAGGVAVWCVVLGLALLVVDAAGKEGGGHLAEEHGDAAHCQAFCQGLSKSAFGPCYNECLYGKVTGQEAARGGGGVGGRPGLLATPTERAGREEEEKRKQTDAVVRLTDPVWCYDACHDQDIMPYDQCVKEYCYDLPDAARLAANGGLGDEEEARGVGADALTAAAVGIHKCDWFRDCSVTPCVWHCGKRRVQEEEDDEETRTGALNVLAAARHEVAVGPCSGTVYVVGCYACCQREAYKDPDFDWNACIRSCRDKVALPIKKEQENKKDGVVPPAK